MTDQLPPNLLALFAPRPALRYLPPSDHASGERKTSNIGGVAQYLDKLQESSEYHPTESWLQRRDRVRQEKKERHEQLLVEGVKSHNPAEDPQIRGDAFKTLFVGRLSYNTKESDLEREFGRFGPIERIRIVTDSKQNDKSKEKRKKKPHCGYAFVVYERERDMKAAYKETDGIRIGDRRVLVDVERGRTVKGWKPRRYGGGLGGRGYTRAAAARPMGPSGFAPSAPGGFRGDRGGRFGGRGGFPRGGGGRGGIGYQGSGGRGGFGGMPNGGQAPPNAPSGPGGGGRPGGFGDRGYGDRGGGGGYGDPRGGRSYDDSRSSYRDGGRDYGDRDFRGGGGSGSNREPVRPREGRGYQDQDREGGYGGRSRDDDYGSRKRYRESEHDDPRQRRRY